MGSRRVLAAAVRRVARSSTPQFAAGRAAAVAVLIGAASPALACSSFGTGRTDEEVGRTLYLTVRRGTDAACGGAFEASSATVIIAPKAGTVTWRSGKFDYAPKPGAAVRDRFVITGLRDGGLVRLSVNVTYR